MNKVRTRLITISERHHGEFHLLFAILTILIIYFIYTPETTRNIFNIIIIAILGSFIPDIDHLFYIFIYGRKSDYAQVSKMFIKNKHIREFIKHVKINHKANTGIYSHNIGSVLLSITVALVLIYKKVDVFWATFFLAWTLHYIYDILEDLLFFSRLNKNWYFRFDTKNKRL